MDLYQRFQDELKRSGTADHLRRLQQLQEPDVDQIAPLLQLILRPRFPQLILRELSKDSKESSESRKAS